MTSRRPRREFAGVPLLRCGTRTFRIVANAECESIRLRHLPQAGSGRRLDPRPQAQTERGHAAIMVGAMTSRERGDKADYKGERREEACD